MFDINDLLVLIFVVDEWNPSHIVKKLTAAEVKTRAGRIIQPIQRVEAGVTAKGHSMNKDWKKRKLN